MKRLYSLIIMSVIILMSGCSLFSDEATIPKANDYLIEETELLLHDDEMGILIYMVSDQAIYHKDSRDLFTLTFADLEGKMIKEESYQSLYYITGTKSGGFYLFYQNQTDDKMFKLYNNEGKNVYEVGPIDTINNIEETENGAIILNYTKKLEEDADTVSTHIVCLDQNGNELSKFDFEDEKRIFNVSVTASNRIVYTYRDPNHNIDFYTYDSDGKLEFRKGPYLQINHVSVESDSSYIYSYQDENLDSYLVRIDEAGNVIFKKGPYQGISDVLKTNNGYVYTINDHTITSDSMNYIDREGNNLFEEQIGPYDYISLIEELSDGSLIYSYSEEGSDQCLRRLTKKGDIVWTNCDVKNVHDIVALDNGQFLTLTEVSEPYTNKRLDVYNIDGEILFTKESVKNLSYLSEREEIFYFSYEENKPNLLNIIDLDGNEIFKEELETNTFSQYYHQYYFKDADKVKVLKVNTN